MSRSHLSWILDIAEQHGTGMIFLICHKSKVIDFKYAV